MCIRVYLILILFQVNPGVRFSRDRCVITWCQISWVLLDVNTSFSGQIRIFPACLRATETFMFTDVNLLFPFTYQRTQRALVVVQLPVSSADEASDIFIVLHTHRI